jgi:hypothetical protein
MSKTTAARPLVLVALNFASAAARNTASFGRTPVQVAPLPTVGQQMENVGADGSPVNRHSPYQEFAIIGYGSDESGHRYAVRELMEKAWWVMVPANQTELAWAEISAGKTVSALSLQKLDVSEIQAQGRSFSYEETKEYSQRNRETRLSASAG